MKKILLLLFVFSYSYIVYAQDFKEEFVEINHHEMLENVLHKYSNEHFTAEDIAHWTHYLSQKLPTINTVEYYMQEAAMEFDVPVILLKAIGQVESNWTQIGPSIDKGWGIMHLVDNPYANTLGEAAKLLGLPIAVLKDHAKENIRGMAALLSHYRGNKTIKQIEDWFDITKKVTGLYNDELSELQAKTYFEVIKKGMTSHTLWGEEIVIKATDVDISQQLNPKNTLVETPQKATLSADYPDAISYLTPCNHTEGRQGYEIDTWVNHWIGVGTYAGAISWFHNCSSKVSAHFVISKEGEITQVVKVKDKAWHCGAYGQPNNQRSIGVEHEATLTNPDYWNNEAMLNASSKMARFFCRLYHIPKKRALPGIRGHQEMPGTSTSCPGSLPWNKWMNKLLSDEDIILCLPQQGDTSVLFPVWFDWSKLHEQDEHYRLQVSTTSEGFQPDSALMFPNPILDITLDTSYYTWNEAMANTQYYWAVQAWKGDSLLHSSVLGVYKTLNSNIGFPDIKISNDVITDTPPQGNGNGMAEAGEKIQLTITLQNNGTFEATDISGTLSVKDEDILLTHAEGNWENIPSSEQAVSSSFEFVVSKYAINKSVPFLLNIHANGKQWTTSWNIPIHCHIPEKPQTILGNPNICTPDCGYFSIESDSLSIYNTWQYSETSLFSENNDSIEICPETNTTLNVRRNNMCGQSDWQQLDITLKEKPESPTIYFKRDTLYCSEGEAYEWYFHLVKIEEANEPIYVPQKNGVYHAKIRVGGCLSNSSNYIRVNTLDGWEESEDKIAVKVYPNPFHHQIIIQNLDNNHQYKVKVLDLNGNVLTSDVLYEKKKINLEKLAPGIYFLKIYDKQQEMYQKLIKL